MPNNCVKPSRLSDSFFVVRSCEAASPSRLSQILGLEAGMFGDSCQHPWTDLFVVVESEHVIRRTFPAKRAM